MFMLEVARFFPEPMSAYHPDDVDRWFKNHTGLDFNTLFLCKIEFVETKTHAVKIHYNDSRYSGIQIFIKG